MEPKEVYEKRDIIIAEMHSDLRHMVEWTKAHDLKDDKRFQKLDDDNQWRDKVIYGGLGIVGFISFATPIIMRVIK